LNVKFTHVSSVARHVNDNVMHVCDAEFTVHAPVAFTLITSHRIFAISHANYLKAGMYLLRANADVAPWMAAVLAGCGRGWSSAWAGVAVAAVTLAVSVVHALYRSACFPPLPSAAANLFPTSGQHPAAESVTPFPFASFSHSRGTMLAAAASGHKAALLSRAFTSFLVVLVTSHFFFVPLLSLSSSASHQSFAIYSALSYIPFHVVFREF
jgi:hypothetical protein